MSRADCFRALGLEPDASWERIRQAYKDLVRVWHPDRFQSDPELQRRAEQQLQTINEAYFALKAPQPHSPGPTVADPPRQRAAAPNRFATDRVFRWPIKLAWLSVICVALLVTGGFLLNTVRVPTLESVLQNGQPKPLVDMPSPLASVHRQAVDLLRSIPNIGERPSQRAVRAVPGVALERDARPATPGAPINGTELLRARTFGGSQLWVSNPANQDAVAKLVDADTATPVRVIYIQAKNKVCIRHIAPGLYHLVAEVGENWDPKHVSFQTGRHAVARAGPFQCIDMTAGRAVSGQCIDVSAAEGATRPKSNIVLATH